VRTRHESVKRNGLREAVLGDLNSQQGGLKCAGSGELAHEVGLFVLHPARLGSRKRARKSVLRGEKKTSGGLQEAVE